MPRKHKIKYTPAAVDDIDEIFSYISQDNIAAAEMMLEQINERITKLAEFPNMGSVLSDEEFTIIKRGLPLYCCSSVPHFLQNNR